MRKLVIVATLGVTLGLIAVVLLTRERSVSSPSTTSPAPSMPVERDRPTPLPEPQPDARANENPTGVDPPTRQRSIDSPTISQREPDAPRLEESKPPRLPEERPSAPSPTVQPTAELPGTEMTLSAPPETVVEGADEAESVSVRRVLDRYRQMYNGLDARQAPAIWPTADVDALARIFARIESQTLTFDACSIALSESAATAHCAGLLEYVPRVGSTRLRRERHSWTIQFQRASDGWHIVNVSAR